MVGMDGTVLPLCAMIDAMDEVFPAGNAHMSANEAHAMEIYGPGGLRKVALLVLEGSVLMPLHTFGEAHATAGDLHFFAYQHSYNCYLVLL
jgi:7-keto-8-aminopelargonate synthetase-like enzyme